MNPSNAQSGSEPRRPAELTAATTPPELIGDCEIMLRFALEEGTELGEALQGQIATLDRWLKSRGEPAISGLPASLITDAAATGEPNSPTNVPALDPIRLLFQVHGQLAKLVSPATPFSLRATDSKRRGLGRMMDMPMVVRLAITAAAICMLGFILTLCASVWADKSAEANSKRATAPLTNSTLTNASAPANPAAIDAPDQGPSRAGYSRRNSINMAAAAATRAQIGRAHV